MRFNDTLHIPELAKFGSTFFEPSGLETEPSGERGLPTSRPLGLRGPEERTGGLRERERLTLLFGLSRSSLRR